MQNPSAAPQNNRNCKALKLLYSITGLPLDGAGAAGVCAKIAAAGVEPSVKNAGLCPGGSGTALASADRSPCGCHGRSGAAHDVSGWRCTLSGEGHLVSIRRNGLQAYYPVAIKP